jgi:hypothetical protein
MRSKTVMISVFWSISNADSLYINLMVNLIMFSNMLAVQKNSGPVLRNIARMNLISNSFSSDGYLRNSFGMWNKRCDMIRCKAFNRIVPEIYTNERNYIDVVVYEMSIFVTDMILIRNLDAN